MKLPLALQRSLTDQWSFTVPSHFQKHYWEWARAVFPLHNKRSCFHSAVCSILQLERTWIICENICYEIQKVKYCLLSCSILKTLFNYFQLTLFQILGLNLTLFDNLAMYILKYTHTQTHLHFTFQLLSAK